MPSQPLSQSLSIINTIEKGTGIFQQFSKLPPELRSRIWKQCLCQERMVQIELVPGSSPADMFEDEPLPQNNQEHLARNMAEAAIELSGNYFVVLRNRHEISKLFRVSVESRQAAKRFYRVQLPCYKQLGSPATEGVFYFNPELDILNINTFGQNYLLRFARMVWDHDPRRIGLVNLALLHYSLRTIFDDLWKTEDEEFMRQFLSGLRRVYLGYNGKLGRSVPTISTSCESFTASTILRSRPLMASVSRFQRQQQDPRAIESELKRVFMGVGDPRDQIYRWFRLLEHWAVECPHHEVEYRFLVTINDRRVQTHEEALASVQGQENLWKKWTKKCKKTDTPVEDPEEELPTAYGFWLFPITAFGPIPEASDNIRKKGMSKISDKIRFAPYAWKVHEALDLSGSKPELCLQSLPEASVSEKNERHRELDSQGSLKSSFSFKERRTWKCYRPSLSRRAYGFHF